MTTQSPIIVALDYAQQAQAEALADQLDPGQCRLKVGKELFTHCGPAVVRSLQDRGFEIFLDLKFHDIPNTVASAVRAAADLGVWMVNVHASGGPRMMAAAAEALSGYREAPLLIAVTVLTSMERPELEAIGLSCDPLVQVQRLARLASDCGMRGVVCSALETPLLRTTLDKQFLLVTPGIRPAQAAHGDQRRVASPAQARRDGSDYLVIGRPITQSADPAAAVGEINQELMA